MTFSEVTSILLNEKGNYKAIYDGLHALHDFYASITGITAHNTTDNNIFLPSGKAISPAQAAHCLLDLQRTAVFMRGIHKAIIKLKQEHGGKPVHILYAGCGPYASLLTPFTTMFSPQEVRFHLVDVNPDSLSAAHKLFKHIQANNYIEEMICADAATYRIDKQVHLVICEAMQPALAKEPQVSIMLNLLPQLEERAIFIPWEIRIDACLLDRDQEMRSHFGDGVPERRRLEQVYSIGRTNYLPPAPLDLMIPVDIGTFDELHLLTDITVFEDEKLGIYESGLTLPVKLMNVQLHRGERVKVEYVMGEKPGFVVVDGV